jgi:ABC-2 type transporter
MLFMLLTLTYFTFYGFMAVALTPSVQLAAVISSTFYSIWNLFSGFIITRPVRSSHLKWWNEASLHVLGSEGCVRSVARELNVQVVGEALWYVCPNHSEMLALPAVTGNIFVACSRMMCDTPQT